VTATIQIKRRVGSAGIPTSLAEGEPAFHDSGGGPAELYIGTTPAAVLTLVGSTRQVEIAGAQTITGAKTIAIANLKITGGAAGNVPTTDGSGNLSWSAGGGGGATLMISDTPPGSPTPGTLWFETDTGILWVYYTDINSSQWVAIGGPPTSASAITISDTPPASAAPGSLWFETDTGILWVYYADINSSQWVAIGGPPAPSPSVVISDTVPASPSSGMLWFETDTGILWVYYPDVNSSQWVQVKGS
jgi:hypothetical protein